MHNLSTSAEGFVIEGGVRDSPVDSLREIWRFRPLIIELVRRDLKVRYKNRIGGVLWSLATPLMQVLTITLMVKFFLGGVANYSAYLMPVMFLWQFFQNCVLDGASAMGNNASLARKIYFPRAILSIVALITNILHFFISLAFTLLYFFTVPISDPIYPKNLHPQALLIIPIVLVVGLLALGIGYLLAYATTLYADIGFVSVTLFSLFFYALPILYPIERVASKPGIYGIYMLNPMASLLVAFQRLLLPPIPIEGVTALQIPWAYVGLACVTSLLVAIIGFLIFERSKWAMMERM